MGFNEGFGLSSVMFPHPVVCCSPTADCSITWLMACVPTAGTWPCVHGANRTGRTRLWHVTARHGMAQHGVARHSTAWHIAAWLAKIQSALSWGTALRGLALGLGPQWNEQGWHCPCQCLQGDTADGTRAMWPEQIFLLIKSRSSWIRGLETKLITNDFPGP